MDFRQLRYFVAVAEELHFTRAAQRLKVAQPTLSLQVRMLEKELGVTLLKRSKRRVELTRPGEIFLTEAKRLLAGAAEAVQAVQSAHNGRLGRLAVVCGPTSAYAGLLGVLELFRRRSPQVDLQVLESPVVDAVQAVEQGKADVGLVVPYFESAVLKREVVLEVPLLAGVAKSHALASAKSLSLKQLADEPFVIFGQRRGSGFYERVLGICHSCGFTPRVVDTMDDIHTLLYVVSAGYAVSLVPASLQSVAHHDVALIPLRDESANLEFAIVWHADRASPVLEMFLETVRGWCRGLRSDK